MTTYGIVGGGTCPKNIIEDGLQELGIEGNAFYFVGTKRPSPSLERVYDFLLDAEATILVACETEETCPKILKDATAHVYVTNKPERHIIKEVSGDGGVILLLWDDANEEEMTRLVTEAYDSGAPIKELSNGLTPVSLAEPDAPTFTKDEFESMPEAIQKRNETSNPTKAEVSPVKVTTPDTEYETRPTLTAPDGDCMVTVVMPNGTVISTPATIEEVRVLLGLSGGS